ncbi:MAG TPA: hypothetical protein VMS76_06215 [Planctomycetota bacterium]|nr:hypothetical protein [Planctomycetota bacterium]
MKNLIAPTAGLTLAFLLLAGCRNDKPSQYDEGYVPPATTGSQAGRDFDPDPSEANIPTQDEANAQASKQINSQNADAEFEKLKNEIGGGE